jgi:hypothetical protein
MKHAALLAFGAVLGLAAPCLAQAECQRPAAPETKIDGGKATMDELLAMKSQVSEFLTASDTFQGCVINELKAKKEEATANKTKVDPAVAKAADASIKQNQADKERVGSDFNAAAKAYKAAHPS